MIPFSYTPTNPEELFNKLMGDNDLQDAFNDAVAYLVEETEKGRYEPFWWLYKETRSCEEQVEEKNACKGTRTVVEECVKVTSFQIYKDGNWRNATFVPTVDHIQFYNDGKVAKVFFGDGYFETASLKATTPEEYEKERKEAAVAICLLKHLLAHDTKTDVGCGSNIYNKWMDRILEGRVEDRKNYKKNKKAKKND